MIQLEAIDKVLRSALQQSGLPVKMRIVAEAAESDKLFIELSVISTARAELKGEMLALEESLTAASYSLGEALYELHKELWRLAKQIKESVTHDYRSNPD